jgi:hypothetical protein
MLDAIAECEKAGYADGLAAGLAQALTGVDVLCPPGPVAAVPAAAVPAGAAVIGHRLADLEGISLVRCADHEPARGLTALGARLGAVRLGITGLLIERAVEHLSGRTAGGEATIRKQLVAGTLADALTATESLRQRLLVAGHVAVAVTDLHDRLNAIDWEVAKLLGASGYLACGPARGAYVARLIANCWIAREAG